ncbi:TPA: host nuclease inhibitor GamL [Citrobacter koseri]|uniref:host nuclease inhibitor GamL n=1 Tax=Citrobacter koseri TaxID=545 RepID=UPI001A1B263F|nr:host nuclease inhibitor GamL [Citrobacter koseri]HDQ2604370.1 host nuclease inhibitor GamL [Citrobacter koseri]
MMPAYLIQDQIKERQDKEDNAALTRDEWIDKRAAEIKAEYPTEPAYFASTHLSNDIRMGLQSSKTIEAYKDFITAAAYDRAEQEWENRFSWLLNDSFN